MVNFTSVTREIGSDRYRPILSLSPLPIEFGTTIRRTLSPVVAAAMGEVCPQADLMRLVDEKSPSSWHLGTDHNSTIVFGGAFAGLTDDIQPRQGPPPPPRPPV